MGLVDWFKHAFAVNTDAPEPAEDELVAMKKVCREAVRRQLTVSAIAFLEMARPLNYLGSQTMQFFAPMMSVLVDSQSYGAFARFLERRDAIDRMLNEIERLEQIAEHKPQLDKQAEND